MPARISAVRSSEPSSITITRRRATGRPSRRSTLSAIVTSSFRAGTRKTQEKASAPSGGDCGGWTIALWPRTKSSSVQRNIAATTTRQTVKMTSHTTGRPAKGQVGELMWLVLDQVDRLLFGSRFLQARSGLADRRLQSLQG